MTAESLLDQFAQAIIARAYGRAESLLAPWMREALPPGGLKQVVHLARNDNPPAAEYILASLPHDDLASMREKVEENAEEEGDRSLATTDGTGGMYGAPSYPIPAELTGETFRGCWRIEFQPDEDLEADVDYSYALYVALVVDGRDLRIGYLEPMD